MARWAVDRSKTIPQVRSFRRLLSSWPCPALPCPVVEDSMNTADELTTNKPPKNPTGMRRAAAAVEAGLWRTRGAMGGLLHVRLRFGLGRLCCTYLDRWHAVVFTQTHNTLRAVGCMHVCVYIHMTDTPIFKYKITQLALQFREGGGAVPQRVLALLQASLAGAERQLQQASKH